MNTHLSARPLRGRRCPHTFRNGQKGALLIGLIIAMVILSALGTSMVYFYSSSVLDPVFSNFSQRAYYAAESGMRYAVSMYRNASSVMTKSQFIAKLNTGDGTTITFTNNGQTVVTATDNGGGGAPTNTGQDQINVGGSLTVADASNFSATNGFFQIKGISGYFRFKEKTNNVLQMISGPGLPLTGTAGKEIYSPLDQVSIKSKGYFPLAGIFGMNRTVQYGWVLSGIPGTSWQPPVDLTFDPTKWTITKTTTLKDGQIEYGGHAEAWGGIVFNTTEGAIQVWEYSSKQQQRFILGYNKQFFYPEWWRQNNYLSYDIQTKIKTWSQQYSAHLGNYMAGLAFRMWQTGVGANYSTLNASFAKGTSAPFGLPTATDHYIIFWRDINGQNRELVAYKKLGAVDTTGVPTGVIASPGSPTVLFSESLTSILDPNTNQLIFNYWAPTSTSSNKWEAIQPTGDLIHPDYAHVTSDAAGTQTLTLNTTWSLSKPPYLAFYQRHNFGDNVVGNVDISFNGGTSWQNVAHYDSNTSP